MRKTKAKRLGGPPPPPSDFIARNRVFRLEEFVDAHRSPDRSPATIKAILQYYVSTGRLWNIRRGLYASAGPVDPWVLATKMTDDAIVAYDGALSFYGLIGQGFQVTFLTQHQVRPFNFSQMQYTPARPPLALGRGWRTQTVEREHAGQQVRVTAIERTLVDILDRLELLRDETLFLTLESIRGFFLRLHFDVDRMIDYAIALDNRALAARLGFFLEFMPNIRPRELVRLDPLRPPSPSYFDRTTRSETEMRYMGRWNLMVPVELWVRLRDQEPVKRRTL